MQHMDPQNIQEYIHMILLHYASDKQHLIHKVMGYRDLCVLLEPLEVLKNTF